MIPNFGTSLKFREWSKKTFSDIGGMGQGQAFK